MTTLSTTAQAHETYVGHHIARLLSTTSASLPNEIHERLRVSRLHAMQAYRAQQRPKALPIQNLVRASRAAMASGAQFAWWHRLATALPVLLLVIGLFGISEAHDYSKALESAATDVALLTDELPPDAYSDPGFIRFVKMHGNAFTLETPGQ